MTDKDITARVESLEAQIEALRAELRAEIKKAAHELRDDSDFAGPYWRSGADHVTGHLTDKAARKLLLFVVGAVTAALLMWLGSLGLLFK